jgi:chromosome segregation ATPase
MERTKQDLDSQRSFAKSLQTKINDGEQRHLNLTK